MITSGVTPKATVDNNAIILIAGQETLHQHVLVVNEGVEDGFLSVDGGISFARLPKQSSVAFDGVSVGSRDIMVKRIFDGNNVTGLFGARW